jgi:hypothetical protein
MTGRVLPFDASSHASADALLPFYVNATLRGEELAFVEQHVRTCEKCQHEVDWLRRIFAELGALQDSARTGIALGSLRGIPSNRKPRIQERFRATPIWARWLLAAQLAAIAILGTSLATDDRVASYRTLGVSNPSTQVRDAFAVMFDPSVTESEMRQIMLRVGARVVDGPTRTGVFVLEVPEGRAVQALQVLRAEPAVRLAEPLGPRTNR